MKVLKRLQAVQYRRHQNESELIAFFDKHGSQHMNVEFSWGMNPLIHTLLDELTLADGDWLTVDALGEFGIKESIDRLEDGRIGQICDAFCYNGNNTGEAFEFLFSSDRVDEITICKDFDNDPDGVKLAFSIKGKDGDFYERLSDPCWIVISPDGYEIITGEEYGKKYEAIEGVGE